MEEFSLNSRAEQNWIVSTFQKKIVQIIPNKFSFNIFTELISWRLGNRINNLCWRWKDRLRGELSFIQVPVSCSFSGYPLFERCLILPRGLLRCGRQQREHWKKFGRNKFDSLLDFWKKNSWITNTTIQISIYKARINQVSLALWERLQK